jgi:hypothetical protein
MNGVSHEQNRQQSLVRHALKAPVTEQSLSVLQHRRDCRSKDLPEDASEVVCADVVGGMRNVSVCRLTPPCCRSAEYAHKLEDAARVLVASLC